MIGRLGSLVAALALVTLTVTGCSEQDAQDAVDRAADEASSAIDQADLPNVDWSERSAQLRNRLEKLAENVDCAGLQRELTRAEGNDAEVTRYIKAQLRELDC